MLCQMLQQNTRPDVLAASCDMQARVRACVCAIGNSLALVDDARAQLLAVGIGEWPVAGGVPLKPRESCTLVVAHVAVVVPEEVPSARVASRRAGLRLAALALEHDGISTPALKRLGTRRQR